MTLTPETYHSPQARAQWVSSSDIKRARRCEAQWYSSVCGKYIQDEEKPAFVYGHLFEAAVCGASMDTISAAFPEIFSTRGPRKGEVKAEYLGALQLSEAVRRSPFLSALIDRCQKQVIFTGTIEGLPVRMMADLLDEDGSIYDIKSARSFAPVWDNDREEYREWWSVYDYPIQLWVYREIARQNGLTVPRVGLIAGDKQNHDVQALTFGRETMAAAGADTRYTLRRMDAILSGDAPQECGRCELCLSQKIITEFTEV